MILLTVVLRGIASRRFDVEGRRIFVTVSRSVFAIRNALESAVTSRGGRGGLGDFREITRSTQRRKLRERRRRVARRLRPVQIVHELLTAGNPRDDALRLPALLPIHLLYIIRWPDTVWRSGSQHVRSKGRIQK